jgi:hypothetical protein
MVTRRGGYLDEIDQFDAQFFGVSPREANLLDPQQRLLLQTAWEALEDGGIPRTAWPAPRWACSSAASPWTINCCRIRAVPVVPLQDAFHHRNDDDDAGEPDLVRLRLPRAEHDGRYGVLEFARRGTPGGTEHLERRERPRPRRRGERHHRAQYGCRRIEERVPQPRRSLQGLRRVGRRLRPWRGRRRRRHQTPGQGASRRRQIYAQILGSAVSQDGHTDSITVPSEDAQRTAITTALRRAGVSANDIGYVEAHGTGTPVGDPIEMRALAGALASDRPATNPLLVGSVKTNIGHLEAGAGVAGLIKTALVLKHGYIPANLHFANPSSRIPFADLHVDVPTCGRPFPDSHATDRGGQLLRLRRDQRPRRARRATGRRRDPGPFRGAAAHGVADLGALRGGAGGNRAATGPNTWAPQPISRWRTSATTSASAALTSAIGVPSSSAASTMRVSSSKPSPRAARRSPPVAPRPPHPGSHSSAREWARSGGGCAGICSTAIPSSPTASREAIASCPATRTGP